MQSIAERFSISDVSSVARCTIISRVLEAPICHYLKKSKLSRFAIKKFSVSKNFISIISSANANYCSK